VPGQDIGAIEAFAGPPGYGNSIGVVKNRLFIFINSSIMIGGIKSPISFSLCESKL
jgi:hypothetical protein